MSTISVPISPEQEKFLESYIKGGRAENKAQVFRRALREFQENEAVRAVLDAKKEPTLRGDLKKLAKRF